MNIGFTSDTHTYHKNITAGETLWTETHRCRQFSTVEEMTDVIIDGINRELQSEDRLYHLGDWSFGGIERIWETRKRINCRNIFLCRGNHDHHIWKNKILPNVYYSTITQNWHDGEFSAEEIAYAKENGQYPDPNKRPVYAQHLFADVDVEFDVKINKKRVIMQHMPLRVWDKSHHGSINLHGHCHDTLPPMTKFGELLGPNNHHVPLARQMDVGMDVAFRMFGEYRPFLWDEIEQIMSTREPLLVDHHNENTN